MVATNPEEAVPFKDACREIPIQPNTGYQWMKAGKFPKSFKIGSKRFVERGVLDAWKAEQKRLSYAQEEARRNA
jgi:predicted DNA-binding transcriptional regulator AlpA